MLQVRKCSPTKPDIKNGEQCFASISLGHSSQCYQRNQCKVRSVTAWKFAVDRDSALTCWDHKLWFANMMNITTQFGFLSFLFFFLILKWWRGSGNAQTRKEHISGPTIPSNYCSWRKLPNLTSGLSKVSTASIPELFARLYLCALLFCCSQASFVCWSHSSWRAERFQETAKSFIFLKESLLTLVCFYYHCTFL